MRHRFRQKRRIAADELQAYSQNVSLQRKEPPTPPALANGLRNMSRNTRSNFHAGDATEDNHDKMLPSEPARVSMKFVCITAKPCFTSREPKQRERYVESEDNHCSAFFQRTSVSRECVRSSCGPARSSSDRASPTLSALNCLMSLMSPAML